MEKAVVTVASVESASQIETKRKMLREERVQALRSQEERREISERRF
jgi:hypothetical protein